LEAAATAESPDDLDGRFWGAGPDSVTAVKAVFADLSDQFAQRQQLAANGISRDDATELLGITAQSVTAKLASRKLVGIKVGREWRLPTWQFDPDVPTGVLPDLDTLHAVFPGGPVSLSRWMLRTQPEFDGRKGSRGDDPSRQCTGHRTRAGFDRHRMAKNSTVRRCPLPKAPFVWWWEPRPEATRWRWCRVYHHCKHAPDGATFRGYGPRRALHR
jgi:hypothetical protein